MGFHTPQPLTRYFTTTIIVLAVAGLLFYFGYPTWGWIALVIASFLCGTQTERLYRDVLQGGPDSDQRQ